MALWYGAFIFIWESPFKKENKRKGENVMSGDDLYCACASRAILVTVWGMFSFWSGDCACKLYDGAYPTGYTAMQPSQSGPLSDILWGKPSGNRHIKEAEAENPELIRKGHCTQLRYQSRIHLRENVRGIASWYFIVIENQHWMKKDTCVQHAGG